MVSGVGCTELRLKIAAVTVGYWIITGPVR
jgi:hypothetical protein